MTLFNFWKKNKESNQISPPIDLNRLVPLLGKANGSDLSVCISELKLVLLRRGSLEIPELTRNAKAATASNWELKFYLDFESAKSYNTIYPSQVQPEHIAESDLFFHEFRISELEPFMAEFPSSILPFDLREKMSIEEVAEHLNQKPIKEYDIFKPIWRQHYNMGFFELVLTFEGEPKLLRGLYIKLYTKQEYFELERPTYLLKQKENVNQDNKGTVLDQRTQLPELLHLEKTLKVELDTVLEVFVEEIAKYTKTKNTNGMYTSIGRAVKKINKLHGKSGQIETMDREIICDFISETLKCSGFQIDTGVDLTEEWRQW
jgi:hypothetical protein